VASRWENLGNRPWMAGKLIARSAQFADEPVRRLSKAGALIAAGANEPSDSYGPRSGIQV
jgi:hypothetical protein